MIRLDLVLLLMALAVSLVGFIPLFPWLGTVPKLFLPGAMLVRLFTQRHGYRLDHRFVTVGSVAMFIFYLLRFSLADIVGPAVNLLVMLLGVRFLGEGSARNYLQLFLLALFCLAASSLYSLDPLFMLYLGLQVIIFPIALVLLTCHDRDPSAILVPARFRSLLSIPLVMLAFSVPLLLFFFIILPRTQVPLWNFLAGSASKTTGFSETVRPGSNATVGESKSVVFRAECVRLSPGELYWRGITLNRFDGAVWSRREPPAGERFAPGKGRVVTQQFILEPVSPRYLVALDKPGQLSGQRGVISAPDFTLSRRTPSGGRSAYRVDSVVTPMTRGRLGSEREFYLQLPERIPPWFREQGRVLRERGGSDGERLTGVETLFRGEHLLYATTGLPVSGEPLVEFLTKNKRGNCEFFASSCALLLRLAGVPARLVGGYLGGEYNQLGGYYVVTGEQAHVWVEAYLEGTGWVRVDPTRWAVNGGDLGRGAGRGAFRSFLLAADTITYFWNRQVITYDLERQMELFTETGRRLQGTRLPAPKRFLTFMLPAAMLVFLWWGVLLLRRRPSREARLIKAFMAELRRLYGVEASPDAGLRELTAGIDSPDPARFVEIHNGALYRDRPLLPEEMRELRGILRRMKKGER